MKTISVIVPVYNVEKYLEECLESICSQTLNDIDVICIDDASTDNSYNLLSELQKRYSFLRVYRNQKNMGLSYTRNVGFSYAMGKYIMYVDSDDYLSKDCLRDLYQKAENEELDVLYFDVLEFENNQTCEKRIHKMQYAVTSGVELMTQFISNQEMYGSVWSAIYRKKYLEENNIRFINGILHEDISYTFSALINAKRASCLNKIVYYYRQRSESILHNPNYAELSRGLVITYASILLSWDRYLFMNDCKEETNEYIGQYVDSVIALMKSRYSHVSTDEEVDVITQNVFSNFNFNYEKDLIKFFQLNDIKVMQKTMRVCVYGAGSIAHEVIRVLIACGIFVERIYVTDVDKNEAFLRNIPIVSYKEIDCSNQEKNIIIATAEKAQLEIVKLLQDNDFRGNIIKVKLQ